MFITISLLRTTLAEGEWTEMVILLLKKKRKNEMPDKKSVARKCWPCISSELPI